MSGFLRANTCLTATRCPRSWARRHPSVLRPSHSPVPMHRPCRIARFARGTAIPSVETASRLHLKTGLKFDIAYRHPIGLRAGRTSVGWKPGPFLPQLVERLAFIVYAGLERRRLGFWKSRRLRISTHAFDIDCWQG